MWRGKSGGDEKSSSARDGSGQSRNQSKGRGKAKKASNRSAPADDPRRSSGKKIRRIESGSPGIQGQRPGSGPVGPRSARTNRRSADQTEIGRPPSGPPGQARAGGPSLPPLRQPTGEMPVVGGSASSTGSPLGAGVPPNETVVVSGPTEGVFAARPTDAVGSQPAPPSSASVDSPLSADPTESLARPPAALDDPTKFDLGDDRPGHLLDVSRDVVGDPSMPTPAAFSPDQSVETGPVAAAGLGAAAAAAGGLGLANSARSDDSPTNPFPDVDEGSRGPDLGQPGQAVRANAEPFVTDVGTGADAAYGAGPNANFAAVANPSQASRPSGAGQPAPPTMRSEGAQRGAGPQSGAKAAASRAAGPATRPMAAAAGPRRGSTPGRPSSGPPSADRLQDTEFKLAGKQRKQKPKEPNRLVLGLAMALVVLVGVGVAYFLTRGDGTEADEVATSDAESAELDPESATTEQQTAATEELPQAEPEPEVSEPTLFFDDAQSAPLQQGEAYSIDLVGEPEGSLLQVVVDDIPQGEPDALLPDLILPSGRHTLHVNMINGDVVAASTPVNVYVLGDAPVPGWRANLSSVNFQTEGWQEAIRQFDEFRAAGHEGLKLYPISDGFWNIFVEGFGEERSAVQSYCESFELEVPVDCFPDYFDGVAAAGADEATDDGAMTEEDGAMTEDDGAMTEEGDAGTTPTTTAGG